PDRKIREEVEPYVALLYTRCREEVGRAIAIGMYALDPKREFEGLEKLSIFSQGLPGSENIEVEHLKEYFGDESKEHYGFLDVERRIEELKAFGGKTYDLGPSWMVAEIARQHCRKVELKIVNPEIQDE